jgi:hypothetical protein
MFEFESTEQVPRSQFCAVYDQRSGRIVHMHEFVGDEGGIFEPDAAEARERMAWEAAKWHSESAHLRVMHIPADFRPEPDMLYRVDLSSGKLVAIPSVPRSRSSHREFVAPRERTP